MPNQNQMDPFFSELLKEFRLVGTTLTALAERVSHIESNITNISRQQQDTAGFEKRITVLEEGVKNITSDLDERLKGNRWFIGIAISLAAILVPIILYGLNHVAWK